MRGVRGRAGTRSCNTFRGVFAAALLFGLVAEAGAQTTRLLVGNGGQGSSRSFDGSVPNLNSVFPRHAQAFTTGASSTGYNVANVEIEFAAAPSTAALGGIVLTIRNASGSNPGSTIVGTLTNPGSGAAGFNTFTAPEGGIDLAASTTYFIDIRRSRGSSTLQFAHGQGKDEEQSESLSGWTIANNSRPFRSGSWRGSIDVLRMKINGRVKPAQAAPTVANAIPNQSAFIGQAFSYQFPPNTFTDVNSDTLTYSATRGDDSALPNWLTFMAATRTFSGTPMSGDTGTLTVKVTADDSNGGTVSDEFDIEVVARPAAPANLQAVVSSEQVELTWDDASDDTITKWQYQQRTPPDTGTWSSWTDIPASDEDTVDYTVTGLTNGTEYEFGVRAVAGSTNGTAATVSATPVAPPAAPTGLTATGGATQVTLNWSNPSNATIEKYQVRYGAGLATDSGFSWGAWADVSSSSATTTSATVTGLTNGTEYTFGVRAVGLSGDGAEATVVATPLATNAPAAPTGFTATAGGSSVTLSWTAPGGTITGYEIRQGTGDPVDWGAWGAISGSDANTTSTTVSSLTVGTAYSFQIRAVNNAVKGAMSDTVSATPVAATVGFKNAILTLAEDEGPVTVTLVLSQAVSADVEVYFTSTALTATKGTDYAAGTVTSPDSTTGTYEVTITASQTEGSTTIAITDDAIPEGNELFRMTIHEIASTVAIGRGTVQSDVIILDDGDTGVKLPDPATLTVTEASGSTRTGTYQVALLVEPTATETVTVAVASQDEGVATVTPASLTFDADDWSTGKTVTVTGVDDEIDQDTDRTVAIRHTTTSDEMNSVYDSERDPADLTVTVTDDDVTAPGVTTVQASDKAVDEADQTDTATFTVVLNTEPSAPVRVSLTPATGLALSTNGTTWDTSLQLDFATGAWSTAQTVMVRATTDSVDSPSARELAVTWAATSDDTDYSGLTGTAATVTVADDDPTTVTLVGATGDVVEGGTKTFTVTLGRGLVDGETLGVPLTFGGTATRGTDYMTACPDTLPTGVTCNDLDDTSLTPTVTFTGPTTGATARTVTLTLSAATDSTTETGGETVIIGFGTLTATGLEGGTSTTDSLADFKITDPDASVPTVAISGIPAKIKTTTALTATFTFSESVTGFVKNDISVSGGTAGTFGGNGTTYTLGITPTSGSNVVVTVAADSATDGTNTGPASAVSATAVWDETAPTVEITGVPGKISNRDAFTVTFTFSEAVTGFATGDVTVTNGDKSAFSGSGSSYTVVVTPNADADVTVTVAADSATDGLNTGPASAESATATWDETAPTVGITGIPDKINNTNALTATFTFSEAVTEFVKSDITVTGGTPGAFAGSGTTYTLAITPTSGSNVVVTVAADSATDGTNTGPASAESKTATWDASVPTVGITGVPARISGTSDLTATFTFSEDVTGFVKNDVTVTGGTAGTFTATSATVYTLVITPDGDANVVVAVTADSATDGLNTGPASAETATAVWTALVFNPAAVTVVEEASATYTVELSSQPDGNVTVTVSGASGEVTFDTDSTTPGTQTTALTFTTTTWDDAQTVTVLAAADNDTANDSATLTHTASGGGYGSVSGDVEVTVTDNDTPGLVLDPTSLTVAEGGSGTYTVALATQPTASVTVTVAGASGEVTVDTDLTANGNQNTLTFTTSDWGTAQTVTVSAGQDNDADDDSATLTHSASGGGYGSVSGNVAVTVTDDDTASVTTATTDATATEGSTTDEATFTVVLNTRPSSDVTVTVTAPTGLTLDGPDSATTFTSSEGLTFTSTNWSTAQTVTVRATDDNDDSPIGRELTVTYAVTSSDSGYSGLSGDAATVTVVDNDPTTVTLAGTAGDVVEGGTKTFTITLNRGLVNGEALSVPLTFGTGAGAATRGTDYTTACPSALPTGVACANLDSGNAMVTFTGPSTGTTATTVTLTLTAATDSTTEAGGETVAIGLGTLNASSGTGLEGGASGTDSLDDFSINDPNTAPVVANAISDRKAPTGQAFRYAFPANTFTDADSDSLTYTATRGDDSALPNWLTFTAATRTFTGTPASGDAGTLTVKVTADDGNGGTVSDSFDIEVAVAAATVQFASAEAAAFEEEEALEVDIDLSAAVSSAAVDVYISSGGGTATKGTDYTGGSATSPDGVTGLHKVTIAAGETSASLSIDLTDDNVLEGLESFTLTIVEVASSAVIGLGTRATATATIEEEELAVVLSPVRLALTEAAGGTRAGDVDVTLAVRPTADVTVAVAPDPATGVVTVGTGSFNPTSSDTRFESETALSVIVADDDTAGLVFDPAALTVAEGGGGTYTVALDSEPTANVTVTVSSDNSDVTVDTDGDTGGNQNTLTFTAEDWETAQTVTVSAAADNDDTDDSATLGHSASGGGYGSVTGDVAVTVTEPVAAPAAPTSFTATAGNARVALAWADPGNSDISDYQFRQGAGLTSDSTFSWGAWTDIASSGATTTGHTVTGLTNGTEYSFQVRAVVGTVLGAASATASATPAAPPPRITGLATLASNGTVLLSWTDPDNDDITKYQYRQGTGTTVTWGEWTDMPGDNVFSGGGIVTYSVTGLTNGTQYSFQVRAVVGEMLGEPSDIATETPAIPPAKPSGLSAAAGDTKVDLSWTNPLNNAITKYQVQWGTTTNGVNTFGNWMDIAGSGASTTSHTVTGLTNGTAYNFRIRAFVGTAPGTTSDVVSATPVPPPAAPMGLTATGGNQQVVLSWTNPNNASITGYQYQQRTAGSNTWGSLTTISDSNATTTTHTVTGLTNYTEYEFRLRVVNPAGGTNSDAVSATPRPANAPGAPTDFTAVAGPGGGQVTLSWTRPSGTITRQEYRVRSPGGDWPGWTNMRSATITTFVAPVGNEPLEFQMRARNGRVLGVLSAIVPATAVAAPAAPTSVTATAGATQVTLGWADPSNSDITKYQYSQRTPPGSGSWGSWTDFTGGTTAASTSGTVTGLTNGTAYEFRVRATAATGGTVLGAASTAVTATPTAAATAPAAPAGFTIDTGDTEITLKWIDPDNSDITKYQYRQGTGPLGSITWEDWTDIPNSDADTTEHTVTGLTNGTGYHFRVRAVAGTLNGAATDSTAITPVAKPAAPTGLTATAGATQVTLNWSDPGNATIEKYQVRYGAGLTTDSGFSWGTWADVSSSSATTTSATVTGLTNGTEYSFGVRAVGLSGDGAEATVVATPLAATAPAAPTSLTAAAGGSSVTLSWTAPGGTITGYEIRQGTGDPVTWGAWGPISASDANTVSTTVGSLTVGTAYSFQIRAVNNAVKGAMSDTVSATPAAATVGFKDTVLTPTENTNLTVTLVLSQAVSADVDIYLTSTDQSVFVTKGSDYAAGTVTSPDGTTGTYEVTITSGQTEGSTTIAILDDTIPEESELFRLAIHEIASTVAIASGTPTTLEVIIADDTDTAIALPNPATLTVTEASGSTRTGTYNVALQLEPNATETVTVAVASQDVSVATVTPASLTFTADDWNIGKTVTVTGVDDEIDQDTDRTVAIRHTATSDDSRSLYTDRDPADLIVTVTDDDVTAPGVTTVQASDKAVDEADQTDTATFTVVLNTEPSDRVRVSLTPATGLALSTNGTTWDTSLQLDFATGSWSTAQTVMVRAATDSVDSPSARELKVTYAATSTDTDYSGLTGDAATVTVADDDATTVTLAGTAGDVVEGGTKTFMVTLGRGLVNGETLPVPLTFGGDATRGTDYTTACPTTLPTGVTCANLDSGTPTVTFTGPSTGATATQVTLTLTAATDNTTETGGESVVIGLGTLNASSGTGLEGGASGTDSLEDFNITDPDASAPTLEISGVPKRITTRAAFTVTFTFSESVTDFVTGDVTVTNGDKSSFTGSGSSYTVVVTPNADADVTVTVDADSATDGTNTGPPADVVATAVFGAPAAPTVTATAGNGQVTLSWTDPSDDTITGYEYQQREEGGTWPNGWTSIANSASLTEYAVTGLTNGTAYEFRVRAVSGTVTSPASVVASATPLAATAPGPPRDLRATPGGGQVVLNWRVPGTNAGAITKYQFRQGTGDPLVWGEWRDASGTTTSHTVTGLTNGTEYSFQVRAVATAVLGAMSDTVEATPNPIPAAPTNFTATKGTASGAIALSWTAPSGPITRYEYRLRPVGGDWPQNWTRLNVPGAISFTVVDQTDGTEYEIEIRAVNGSGAGAAASASATPLDPTAAAAPTSFTATAGSGQVDLAWTAPSGTITKYQVRQGTGDPVVWGAWAGITGTTSHTVTGLTNGTEYSFQVRAVTGTSVLGAMSATATATPTAAPGVTFSVTDATVSEADRSDTATFTVVLNTRPSANVEMTINAPVGLEIDGPDLDSNFARTQSAIFSTTNWSTAQTVTVRASSESTDHPSSREEVIGYITISSDTDYIDSRGVGPTVTVVDNDATTVTLAGTAEDVAEGATKTFTVTLGRGLVDGETLGVPLAFTGTATRGTDYMTACPDTLPTGVTCNDLDDTSLTPTVTFTGPTTGATARTVTLTLTAATDSTTEAGGETVIIGFGTLSATGLEGGTSTTDSLADFKITDPDASVPTVAITGIPDKIKTTTALTATFTFSEAVTGFVKNDITVTGGTAGTFGGSGTTYTLGITPTSGSNVVVTVAADSATDGTNTGPASAVSATAVWDETAPAVEITGVPGKISNRDAFTVTFTFSEAVTGFATGDVTVTNGDKSAFSGSGSSYTVVVTPNADADVTVTVAADSATDGLNTGPASAVSATATWDETAPTVEITGIPAKINNTNALTATFTFSEDVTGFVKNDITVTGGTAGTFTATSATVYTLAIIPTSGSNVVVTVAANSATDGTNTGPASAESKTATWDASVPTVGITGVPARISGTSDLTATFTFSEDVTGFVKNDITVTGGTAGTFTATSAKVYTLVITPDGDANVVVAVTADSATDGLNTGPASAETATAVWTALVFNPAAVTVVEEASATYTVELSSQPDGNVTVTVGGASGEVTFDTDDDMAGTQTTALTFSTTNWSTAQTVTVLAAADNDTANDSATLTHTAAGGGYGSVTGDVEVTVTDNDTPGLVLDPTALTVAEGGSGTYTVKLATQPTGTVTVTVAGASGDVTADTNSVMNGDQDTLTFTTTNWNMAQTVTVSADEDDDTTNDSATLTHSASGGGYGSVTGDVAVTVTDDDTASLVIDPTALTVAEGGSGTYTVKLATQPTGNVTVTVAGASGEVTVDTDATAPGSQSTLTFTDSTWSTARTVTVSAGEDNDGVDDSATLAHSASGGGYGSVTGSVAVTVTDDDTAPAAPASFTAAAGNQQVVLSWTDPENSAIDSWQFRQRTPPSTGAWGSWTAIASSTATTTTHTVAGLTNGTAYGFQVRAVDGALEGAASAEATATPAAPVTVAFAAGSTAVTVAEGDDSHAELTLALSAARGAATRVRLVSVDTGANAGADFAGGPYTVDFPAGDTRATLRIAIEDDNVPEESEAFSVTIVPQDLPAGVSVGAPSGATVTIRDDDQPHPAPTGLMATPGAGSVALAWSYAPPAAPAVDRTADFQYRRGTGDPVSWGAWTTIPGSGPGTRSHTARGLAGGAEYAFQVRARSRPGSGFRPGLSSATARATPLAGLADKVRGWMAEASCAAADACVAHWKRALKALGQAGPDLADVEPMTFGEALTLAYTPAGLLGYTPAAAHGARWLEVAKALQALEVERVVVTIAASPAGPVAEGAELTFTLTAAAKASTTFDLFVTVADATGGGDFLAAADEGQRRVQLKAGATSASFKVRTVADRNDEPDGMVAASLAAVPAVYTVGSPASASVQVTDNDGEGTVAPAAPADFTAAAGDARVVLRWTKPSGNRITGYEVRRRTPPGTGTWGDWTPIADSDADTVAHTVADLANGTAYGFEVRALAGALAGAASSEASATPSAGAPPPVPGVSIAAGPGVSEGAGATFTLTAAPPPAAPLAVSVAVSQGGDFAASGQIGARTVTVPTSGTATFAVRTVDDTRDEPDGTVTAAVSAGTGYTVGSTASATVAVADNDAAPATCPATAAGLIDTVRRYYEQNRNNPARNFGENWRRVLIAFGAKPAGTPDAAPFTAAEARAGEAVWDGWRPVRVELERLEACPGRTPPRVPETTPQTPQTPPSTPRVAVAAGAGVAEGTAAAFTLTATPAPAADLTVNYTVSDAANADFVAAGGEGAKTAVIRAGESSADIEVATAADTTDEPSGSVSVTVDSGDGYAPGDPASAEVRVADDDATTVALAGPAGDIAEDGGTKAFTVTLGRTLEAHESLRVPLVFGGAAARGADWTAACAPAPGVHCGPLHTYVSPHVEFVGASGAPAQATVTLAAVPDSLDEGAGETVTVAIGTVETNADGGAAASGSLSFAIADDDDPPPAVTVMAGPGVTEGADAVFTITVSPAPSSALKVNYAVSDADGADFVAAADEGAKTLNIAASATSATVTVPTVPDAAAESSGDVSLRLAAGAGYRLGDPPSAAVRVSDDDGAASLPGLSISDARGGEGEPMRFTITLSPASEKTVRVRMDVRDATPPSARWERYDYARPYYDVTFAPGETEQRRWVYIYDDAHDEGEETFEAVLSRAEGAVIAKAVGVGTIANDDPLPAAYLARFGRAVADQALAGVAGRIAAARPPGLDARLAGGAFSERPEPDGAGGGMEPRAMAGMASGGGFGGMPRAGGQATRPGPAGAGMSVRDALLSSGFSLTGGGDAAGGSLALWGRAAQGGFGGEARGAGTGVRLDGEASTAMLGADYARGGWLVGLALARSASEGGYAGLGGGAAPACPGGLEGAAPQCGDGAPRVDAGKVRASLASVTPYAALRLSERFSAWGAAGAGAGEVALRTAAGSSHRAGTRWRMAAAGARGELPAGGGALALTSDALWTRTDSEATRDLAASSSATTRLRLGIEGGWRLALGRGMSLAPTLEAGARHDGGDAGAGFGVELGGGLAWAAPALGLALDVSGRALVAHEDGGMEDMGFSAALAFDPAPGGGRGPSLGLRRDLGGRSAGGLEALLRPAAPDSREGGGAGGAAAAAGRWAAEAAWGLPAFGGRFTGAPHAGVGLGAGAREYTLGWRLAPHDPDAPEVSLGVRAARREGRAAKPEHAFGLEIEARW